MGDCAIKELSSDLTKRYRQADFSLPTAAHLGAYRQVRMPATHAAIRRVLHEIRHLPIKTVLDLGAGPGTGWCAARAVFPALQSATFVEKDKRWHTPYDHVEWIFADLRGSFQTAAHDLVLLSYAIGEIPEEYWGKIVTEGFNLSQHAFVIVEPGTPQGSARILSIRQKLLQLGAHILAPCPHAKACPMEWCHFSVRLSRTSSHRQAKGGVLGYEDEKFSYLIVSKTPASISSSRIVRSPIIRSGHLSLTLCTPQGTIEQKTFSRRQGNLYKRAKKVDIGDMF